MFQYKAAGPHLLLQEGEGPKQDKKPYNRDCGKPGGCTRLAGARVLVYTKVYREKHEKKGKTRRRIMPRLCLVNRRAVRAHHMRWEGRECPAPVLPEGRVRLGSLPL